MSLARTGSHAHPKTNPKQNELEFPQITWTNCDSSPEAEHIASSFCKKKKNEKEGMFAGNKNPAIQQYLSQRADEMCQMQPGLNVKQSPGDAEKQAG